MRNSHGLLLLSGGFDSPVAGFMVKEKGATVGAVHFSSEPFSGNEPEVKSRLLVLNLGFEELLVVPLGAALETIAQRCEHRLYFVLMKRLMLRMAEKLANDWSYNFLITGESLGQVSSQTLANLSVIHNAITIPILRPLIGLSKEEIIDMARKIETYEISKGPEVCDMLGPKHPATRAKLAAVEAEEAKLDMGELIPAALSSLKTVFSREKSPT